MAKERSGLSPLLWSRCVRHLNRFDGDGGTLEQWQTLCPPPDESMESRIHREVYGRFGGEHPETRLRQEISALDA